MVNLHRLASPARLGQHDLGAYLCPVHSLCTIQSDICKREALTDLPLKVSMNRQSSRRESNPLIYLSSVPIAPFGMSGSLILALVTSILSDLVFYWYTFIIFSIYECHDIYVWGILMTLHVFITDLFTVLAKISSLTLTSPILLCLIL